MISREGTRPLLVEVQSMMLKDNHDVLHLVLNKKHVACCHAPTWWCANHRTYVNIVGGLKITETGSDLALPVLRVYVPKHYHSNLQWSWAFRWNSPSTKWTRALAAKHGFKYVILPRGNAPQFRAFKWLLWHAYMKPSLTTQWWIDIKKHIFIVEI